MFWQNKFPGGLPWYRDILGKPPAFNVIAVFGCKFCSGQFSNSSILLFDLLSDHEFSVIIGCDSIDFPV